MGATFPRVKVWTGNEDVTNTDLSNEFNNILNNLTPSGTDDHSTSAAQMRLQTNPGTFGNESLATSSAGEIERIRFALARILGETYWYLSPDVNLSEVSSILAQNTQYSANRVVSGRVRTTSQQPVFLVPDGTDPTVRVLGSTTPFKYRIQGTEYTINTDVELTGLLTLDAAGSQALVNDSTITGHLESRYAGEIDSGIPSLTIDVTEANIVNRVGQYSAFDVNSEVFFAYVASSTSLEKGFRGYFFDSSDAPVIRGTVADNDTVTMLKLAYIFAKTDLTLTATYNDPVVSFTQPSSPASGDFWFDLGSDVWKIFSGGSYGIANATLIGICAMDGTGCKWARSFESQAGFGSTNTLILDNPSDVNTVSVKHPNGTISVYGTYLAFDQTLPSWVKPDKLEADFVSSGFHYLYITEQGLEVISDKRPYAGRVPLMQGYYHPYQSWRAVGVVHADAASSYDYDSTTGVYGSGGFSNISISSLAESKVGPIAFIDDYGKSVAVSVVSTATSATPIGAIVRKFITGRRPVQVGFTHGTTSGALSVESVTVGMTVMTVDVGFLVDGVLIAKVSFGGTVSITGGTGKLIIPPPALSTILPSIPAAGYREFTATTEVNSVGTTVRLNGFFTVWEL